MEVRQNISGADAEKLADCIYFAGKQGLIIGEETQAGVNQNFGNVWLWDEDWPACIYQDAGFSGARFSYTCPNCGFEQDCSTISECKVLSNRFDNTERCKECQ